MIKETRIAKIKDIRCWTEELIKFCLFFFSPFREIRDQVQESIWILAVEFCSHMDSCKMHLVRIYFNFVDSFLGITAHDDVLFKQKGKWKGKERKAGYVDTQCLDRYWYSKSSICSLMKDILIWNTCNYIDVICYSKKCYQDVCIFPGSASSHG